MPHSARIFQVLPQLLQLNGVLPPELLHLGNGLSLVNYEFLIPHGCERLELSLVLLLDLHFLPRVLIHEADFETGLSLLPDLYDPLQLLLRVREVTIALIKHPLGV